VTSSLALTFPINHRAGLPNTPPSITLQARSPTAAGPKVLVLSQ
jgi:hypothetical protein